MAQRDNCFAKEIAFFRNFAKRIQLPIDNIFVLERSSDSFHVKIRKVHLTRSTDWQSTIRSP